MPLPLSVILGVMIIRGFASAPYNPLLLSLPQEQVPTDLRGRIFGANAALSLVGTPVRLAQGGYLVDSIGVRLTLLAMAAGYLAATIWLLRGPPLHTFTKHAGEWKPES